MKKKLLSLALVFVMALTLLPTAAFAEEESPDLSGQTDQIQQTQPDASADDGSPAAPDSSTSNPDSSTGDPDSSTGNPDSSTPGSDGTTGNDAVCTGGANCTAKSHKVDCVSLCTENNSCTNAQGNAAVHKANCPKAEASTPPATTTCSHPNAPGTMTQKNTPKDATCAAEGEKAYYQCETCKKYFIAGALGTALETAPDTAALKIPATGTHTAPSDGSGTPVNVSTHTYTCTACQTAGISGTHSYNSSNICTVCGFERTATPSPSGAVRISSAYVNSYSISLTWASDLPAGTLFDIYVDGSLRAGGVAPSKSSGGYFSYTVDFSHYLGDRYYNVAVYLYSDHSIYDSTQVYNRYYDHDYWYPDYYPNNTPSTNSYGIPYASQVNGRYSASEAIRILRNKNQNTLQYDLLNSTSASNSFYDLEQAVKRANNVSVQVDIDRSDVPSAIRNIQITGAAFNASSTNSTVRLVVDAPSQGRYSGYGYAFSMSLTGVGGDSSLDVPVKITMPVPSNISSGSVRILHYHNSSVPTVIEPKISGSSMSFTLTGFSDFVITDNRVDPYYYYYTPGVPASARRNIMQEHLAVVLPILASMPPSGYIFDDVSAGHWAAAEIAWARDGGMMSGYYDGTFRPYAATTRQELWMVLARLAGARPADMWAAREWAMNAGISDGRNPHSPLSRQQMISMLYRYAQYLGVDTGSQASLRSYGDSAAISGYARNAMAWAIDQGIIAGDFDGLLHPQDIATRADFAVYLYRFIY